MRQKFANFLCDLSKSVITPRTVSASPFAQDKIPCQVVTIAVHLPNFEPMALKLFTPYDQAARINRGYPDIHQIHLSVMRRPVVNIELS